MTWSISIHALREEGDLLIRWRTPTWAYFYPRPPRGGRPCPVPSSLSMTMISIHALREEGDPGLPQSLGVVEGISIHALREEGDP